MTTLINYYQKIKDKLKSQLQASTAPEVAVKVIQGEIDKLMDINSEYMQGLTPPQARLARTMLQSLSQYTRVLLLVKPQVDDITQPQQINFTELTTKLVSPITNAIQAPNYKQVFIEKAQQSREFLTSLLAGGLAGVIEGGWYWGLIGAAIGGITGGTISQVIKYRKPNDIALSSQPQLTEVNVNIDINKLLDYLYQAFQSIDITVSAYRNSEKAPKPGIENNLDLLEYLQDLMADGLDNSNQLPVTVRRRIEQASSILRHYGIEARTYKSNSEPNTDQDMFYFEPSIDAEVNDYITLKPALVKDNQVILPGYVIEPTKC
ncbi:hypothetical protein NIES4071_37160 [Calothrix sp. NIES-4071]|nr:hypothetical protein NIES4071_37160 [Calothrix sp. NIES-4071]BAZ58035.1 hypothetical protein NIES4105_37090 [Calothrix sp. NIES-4105]